MTLPLNTLGCFEQLSLVAISDFLKIFPLASFTAELVEGIFSAPKIDDKALHLFDSIRFRRCYISLRGCRLEVSLNFMLWDSLLVKCWVLNHILCLRVFDFCYPLVSSYLSLI